VREHALHRSLMDVAVIPVDERFLALEPRKDYLPSARRPSGLNAKTSRRRLERIDDVGKAGRWSLRGGAVRPGTQRRECEGHNDLHVQRLLRGAMVACLSDDARGIGRKARVEGPEVVSRGREATRKVR